MRLRTKFTWFAVLIHVLLIALTVLLYTTNKYLFLAAEAILIVSIAVTFQLYRAFLKPLDILAAGVESIRDKDFSTTFRTTGQTELDRLIHVYNSMIEQLRNERVRQREQHYFLQRLIEASPIGIIILDLDDRINMINPVACNILGATSDTVTGGSISAFTTVPGCELGDMVDGETRIVSVSGIRSYKCRVSHFVDRGFPRRFIMIEELTSEIMTAQKRAYDKVIRMMSHEINNSVGAVNSILDSSLHYAKQLTPEDRADFENAISVAIERNTGLNRFMANFADVVRIPPPTLQEYDLCELLRSVQVLMHAECTRRQITWQQNLPDQPFTLRMDVEQMQQVLVNVVKNAIEAVDQEGEIEVSVSTERHTLSVFDTGRGVADDDRPFLFTPFFSTKRDGQGIGLTLIREILVNHGFVFGLEPTDDNRTEFRIEFSDRS